MRWISPGDAGLVYPTPIPKTLEKANAILLSRTPLTETSLIVHWCSLEHGLIRTVAKGARRPGSPFGGRLDLFLSAEIEYTRGRKSNLHTLQEARVSDHRAGLQLSYPRLLAAAYFAKLVDLVAEGDHPIESLYDLLRRGLDWLCTHEPDLRAVLFFEKEVTRALGIHGEEDVSPIRAIRDLYQRVPEQREKLMEVLR